MKSVPVKLTLGLAALVLILCPVNAQTTQSEYAGAVANFSAGSGSNNHPNNILGNTSGTYAGLGNCGQITVTFSDAFTTTGNSTSDLDVDESGDNDCWWVCLKPANQFTLNAIQNAGWQQYGQYYQIPTTYCGNDWVDIDHFLPGFHAGELKFSEFMIEDDCNGSDGAEIKTVWARNVCTTPPTPPTLPNCVEGFGAHVISYHEGTNSTDPWPHNALGNDPNSFVGLGVGGNIKLSFADNFVNTGDAAIDLEVTQWGNPDCYDVRVKAANSATTNALNNAGLNSSGGFYTLLTACGSAAIDIDAIVTGASAGSLVFSEICFDDANGGNGSAEIAVIRAPLVCTPPAAVCVPEFASSVLNVTAGAGSALDPTNALGNTPSTTYRVGRMGCITLGFSNVFTTTGDSAPDFNIVEDAGAECYFIDLRAATSGTANTLANAGWVQQPNGMFRVPNFFCDDASIDLDTIIPGNQNEGDLRFRSIRICDQSNTGTGADITTVEATRVCPDIASVGDRVWVDANGNGLQDAAEVNVPGVIVKLYDATGTTVLDETVTDAFGNYVFSVDPGMYVIGFEFDGNLYFVTSKNSGNDPELDSDVNANNNRTDVFTVGAATNRRDIDLGLAFNCVGVTASAVTLNPACSVPNEPQLTVSQPAIGLVSTISVTSNFPNARVFLLLSMGAPVPFSVPGTTCNTYIDFTQMFLLLEADTDSNGNWSFDLPLPVEPNLIGVSLTLQARVCLPSIPGPIPGFPDWLTNGVFVTFGCP